ncbi:MAG: class I SAM-dependent methyltransferase [Deltaproteobacteria bacterium]|nr:class I SAM-dependent methyltransferase [Deltaproteobacteria bacterium]
MDRIEIIDSSIIENNEKLSFIDHWKRVLGIEIGWHYDLDIIWILRQIEELGIEKGSTILDAGAGNGLLQFMLASLGFNVLSVDFADRDVPAAASRIFKIEVHDNGASVTNNPYRYFIKHRQDRPSDILNKMLNGLRSPGRTADALSRIIRRRVDPAVIGAALSGARKGYGNIKYIKSDFTDMKEFETGSVDCIVSVSAIEHNGHEDLKKSVGEFMRILKKGSAMIITTSAAKDRDWYFKSCEGWCFSYDTLRELFSMKESFTNFDRYDELFEKIKRSETIRKRVSKLYATNGDNGLPWGIYDPKYQPAGILKIV